MSIRAALPSDVPSLARIHSRSLPDDFLPSLGWDFLEKVYYPAGLTSSSGRTLVAEQEGSVAGFVTIAHDSDQFARDVLHSRGFVISAYALRAALRHPPQILKSFEVLWSVLFSKPDPVKAEIVFIAVDQEYQNQGIGQTLVRSALKYLRSKQRSACRTKTLVNNTGVIRLYEKMGWRVRNHIRLIGREYVILVHLDIPDAALEG